MLIIRNEQLAALGQDRAQQSERRMAEHIAHAYPDDYAAMGEDGAARFVRQAVESAASRGIRGEGAVSILIGLFIEYGTEFERAPYRDWALRILAHPTLPGHLKVSLIRNRLGALTQGRRIVRFEAPS